MVDILMSYALVRLLPSGAFYSAHNQFCAAKEYRYMLNKSLLQKVTQRSLSSKEN